MMDEPTVRTMKAQIKAALAFSSIPAERACLVSSLNTILSILEEPVIEGNHLVEVIGSRDVKP